MTEIEQRINDVVSNFVNEITRLAREAAVSTLNAALASTGGTAVSDIRVAGRRGRPPGRPAGSGSSGSSASSGSSGSSSSSASAASRRTKGAKRPPTEIAETKTRVHSHIRNNPGQRIEQINKMLGTRTSDLSLPLKKLLSEGAIRTEGARRATKYFPGDGKPSGGGGGGKAGRGRRKKKG